MIRVIANSLLSGALLLGFNQPSFAGPDFKDRERVVVEGRQLISNVVEARDLTKDQKIDILSQAVNKSVYDLATMEAYVNWLIEGITKAVGASPLEIQDSIPPNMENADIPEFLVKQLQNPSAKGSSVGLKSNELMVVFSMPITKEEYRKNRDYDEFVNLFLNKGGANMHFEDPNGVIKK